MSDNENDDDVGLCDRLPPTRIDLPPGLMWKDDDPPYRELSISGEICDEMAKQFEIEIRKLQQLGADEIIISIDSGGGEVFACMRMMSLINSLEATVTTICKGRAESAASILFSCGDRRVMGPLSKLMIHNIHTSSKSQETRVETRLDLEETERINKTFCEAYARASNKTTTHFMKMMERNVDIIFTPDEALDIGLATHVGYVDVKLKAELQTYVQVRSTKKMSRKRKRLT